jgi:hypothetical protein
MADYGCVATTGGSKSASIYMYIYKVFYNLESFWIKHVLPRAEARVDD